MGQYNLLNVCLLPKRYLILMKPSILAIVALLTSIGLVTPVKAENLTQIESQSPKPASDRILAACAQDQAQTLPSPYADVPQNHWAYKAVLSMYYCGAYRGQVAPEQFQRLQERQNPQQN